MTDAPAREDAARLRALARVAANEVRSGMLVGLGTGSTAEALLRELGQRVANGLAFTGVPTSERTRRLAESLRIPLRTLDDVLAAGERLDCGIDGADEIDPRLNVTKGRGGALLFEKLVAVACRRYVIIAADAKLVERLGSRMPLPVEAVAMGWPGTRQRLREIGVRPELRSLSELPDAPLYRTDSEHLIFDCETGPMTDPGELADRIKQVTGVVDHGLFLGMVDAAYVVDARGSVRMLGSRQIDSRTG